MKHRLVLFYLMMIMVAIIIGGCGNLNEYSNNESQSSTTKIFDVNTDSQNGDELQTTTTSKTTEFEITEIYINMTDDEIYELGIKRANELHELFMDFLIFDMSELIFPFDYWDESSKIFGLYYEYKNGEKNNEAFYIAKSDTINTYADLYALFNETCTLEYSTELLKFTSHQYTDIDGQLYFTETLLTWPLTGDNDNLISFEVVENQIKLNFLVTVYGPDSGPDSEFEGIDKEYSIFLKYIDGEWLVSRCTNIFEHGYFWSSDK